MKGFTTLLRTDIHTVSANNLTENVRDREKSVKSKSHHESEDDEGDGVREEGGHHAGDEADDVTQDYSGHTAVRVSKPSEKDHARNGAQKEAGLGEGGDPGLVAHPVHLHGDGDVVALHVILPALVTGHRLIATGHLSLTPLTDVSGHVVPVYVVPMALAETT